MFKKYGTDKKYQFHMASAVIVKADGTVDLTEAIAELPNAVVCDKKDFVYATKMEDGDITGELLGTPTDITGNVITFPTDHLDKDSSDPTKKAPTSVMLDYYVDLDTANVWEADITADTFAGYYYVEADTLVRRQADGKDLPANLTFPNVKLQSAFTITMSGTGDPSTFTFTFDAFPGYTYFDKTKKVLSVLQVVNDVVGGENADHPVMLHDDDGGEGN